MAQHDRIDPYKKATENLYEPLPSGSFSKENSKPAKPKKKAVKPRKKAKPKAKPAPKPELMPKPEPKPEEMPVFDEQPFTDEPKEEAVSGSTEEEGENSQPEQGA